MTATKKPMKWDVTPERKALLHLKDIFETGGDGQYSNELSIINKALTEGETKLISIDREPIINETIPL